MKSIATLIPTSLLLCLGAKAETSIETITLNACQKHVAKHEALIAEKQEKLNEMPKTDQQVISDSIYPHIRTAYSDYIENIYRLADSISEETRALAEDYNRLYYENVQLNEDHTSLDLRRLVDSNIHEIYRPKLTELIKNDWSELELIENGSSTLEISKNHGGRQGFSIRIQPSIGIPALTIIYTMKKDASADTKAAFVNGILFNPITQETENALPKTLSDENLNTYFAQKVPRVTDYIYLRSYQKYSRNLKSWAEHQHNREKDSIENLKRSSVYVDCKKIVERSKQAL